MGTKNATKNPKNVELKKLFRERKMAKNKPEFTYWDAKLRCRVKRFSPWIPSEKTISMGTLKVRFEGQGGLPKEFSRRCSQGEVLATVKGFADMTPRYEPWWDYVPDHSNDALDKILAPEDVLERILGG